MLRHLYFSLRALRRDRIYSGINLLGLATGMAAAMLVLLWVQDELTFDRMHHQGKNIVRVLTNWEFGGNREWSGVTAAGLAPAAKAEAPEVQEAVRVWRFGNATFQLGAAILEAENALIVDNAFFEVFDFPLVRSDGSTPLQTPNGILLTESQARRFFADADPLGKSLRFENKIDLVVTGIMKDPPSNSSIQFSCILPWEPVANQYVRNPEQAFHWGMMNYTTWLLVRPEADRAQLARTLTKIGARHRKDRDDATWYALQPLHQVYLDSDMLPWWSTNKGDRKTIALFGLIGLLILSIACINYVNLATARASTRAKEVGVRKTIGAGRGELFAQFLTESALLIAIATFLGILIAQAILPLFNELSGKNFNSAQLLQINTLRIIGGTAVLALLLAGIYPALLLTRFNPAAVLKGQIFRIGSAGKNSATLLRKTLVTGQFVFSLALITGALVISRQMTFLREAKLGYERENIFAVNFYGSDSKPQVIKTALQGKPGVAAVTMSDNNLVELGAMNGGIDWEGRPEGKEMPIWMFGADTDVRDFFGLELKEGRWFREALNGWDTTSFILNESATRAMGLTEGAAGKWVDFNGTKGLIAGVVRDFHFRSLHDAIEPLIIYQQPAWSNVFYLKTKGRETPEAIASAKAVFEKLSPGQVFKYAFLDETYDNLYKTEARVGTLFNFFAGLAVLISCLGLLGLATFAAQHRTKEIGIRKVLGASVASVIGLLAKDFLKLVFIAFLIAAPLSWWFTNRWLEDFAYRIAMPWWVFVLAGLATMVLASLTVGAQSLKTALTNPAQSLKNE